MQGNSSRITQLSGTPLPAPWSLLCSSRTRPTLKATLHFHTDGTLWGVLFVLLLDLPADTSCSPSPRIHSSREHSGDRHALVPAGPYAVRRTSDYGLKSHCPVSEGTVFFCALWSVSLLRLPLQMPQAGSSNSSGGSFAGAPGERKVLTSLRQTSL